MKLKKVHRTLVSLVMVCAMSVSPVLAAPEDDRVEELQGEKAQAESEMNSLQNQLNDLVSTINDLELQLIEKGQQIAQAELDLQAAQEEEEAQYQALLKRIKCMYEEGDSTAVENFFSAGSFSEALTKAEYAQKLHEYDRAQLEVYQEAVQNVKDLKAQLEREAEELRQKEAEYQAKSDEVTQLIESKRVDIANLDDMIQEAARIAQEAQRRREEEARREAERLEQERLAAERRAAEAAAAAAAANNSSSSSSSGTTSKPKREPVYNVATGNAIVDRAYSWVGNADYVWGACSPGAFDCSGFVSYCLTGSYSRLGTTYTFLTWPRVSDPQPGDICVNATHCGVYIGGGQMIHAANSSVGVIVGSVPSSMVYVRY